ncbi:hypothetical protein GCM10009000_030700 [Halobacterium noricense]
MLVVGDGTVDCCRTLIPEEILRFTHAIIRDHDSDSRLIQCSNLARRAYYTPKKSTDCGTEPEPEEDKHVLASGHNWADTGNPEHVLIHHK